MWSRWRGICCRRAACSRFWRTERQHARLQTGLAVGDPHGEVELAWSCYQQLRTIYAGTASLRERKTLAERLLATLHTCPIPEVARLGRTLRA